MLGAALAAGSGQPLCLAPSTLPLPSFRQRRLRLPAAVSGSRAGLPLAVVSAGAFASLTVLGTIAFEEGVNLLSLLSGRFVLAALVFWVLVHRRGARLPELRVTLAALALGAVVYAVEAGLLFGALDRMRNAALLDLLLYAYPALVTLAVVLMGRERLTRRRVAALAVSTVGVALVLIGGGGGALDGVALAMAGGATLLYTAYVLLADALLRRTDPLMVATLVTTGAGASFSAAALTTGRLQTDLPARGLACMVAIALVSTVVALLASFGALQRLGASKSS